jgi:hypothetical protein
MHLHAARNRVMPKEHQLIFWELGPGNTIDGRAKTAASSNFAIAAAWGANILV